MSVPSILHPKECNRNMALAKMVAMAGTKKNQEMFCGGTNILSMRRGNARLGSYGGFLVFGLAENSSRDNGVKTWTAQQQVDSQSSVSWFSGHSSDRPEITSTDAS